MNTTTTFPILTQALAHQLIEPARLNKFFSPFREELAAADVSLPDHESANGNYYESISAALASPAQLPAPLRVALMTLEKAAAPDSANRLDDAIQRRIPCVNLHNRCQIDCALELWFAAPDELAQFTPSRSASSPASSSTVLGREPLTGNGSEIQMVGPIPNSEIAGQTGSVQNSTIEALTHSPTHPVAPKSDISASQHVSVSAFLNLQPSTRQLSTSPLPPWPNPVNGALLLDTLAQALRRFVVLPLWAAETLALWIVHTFAFQLRDVSTYIGVESPEKQCGKTTLLTVLSELANRTVTASNISPPAFFRVIEDLCPTLLIDEADTFLRGNEQLKGILNAGYKRKTAFVLRAAAQAAEPSEEFPLPHGRSGSDGEGRVRGNGSGIPLSTINSQTINSPVTSFSCWCPKLISQIGRLPTPLPTAASSSGCSAKPVTRNANGCAIWTPSRSNNNAPASSSIISSK